jgi:putative acetyltransferase
LPENGVSQCSLDNKTNCHKLACGFSCSETYDQVPTPVLTLATSIMLTLKRTTSDHPDFRHLVALLDQYLAERNGNTHGFYSQYNKLDLIRNVVVVYEDDEAVGCGAMKAYDKDTMEIKRMYVPVEKRGNGIASKVLKDLENWARELGFNRCVLETGKSMTDAVGLYTKSHFKVIPNYGQYANVENSVCFEKELIDI